MAGDHLDAEAWQCQRCNAWGDDTTGEWRYVGGGFEHKCPDADPQAGHFPARLVARADLRAQIAKLTAERDEAREDAHVHEVEYADLAKLLGTRELPGLGGTREDLVEAATRLVAERDSLRQRGAEAEAQAASMRSALVSCGDAFSQCVESDVIPIINAALASDAGRAVFERLKAADELADAQAAAKHEALGRLAAMYESEYDADAPVRRPDWLERALAPDAGRAVFERLKAADELADAMDMLLNGEVGRNGEAFVKRWTTATNTLAAYRSKRGAR